MAEERESIIIDVQIDAGETSERLTDITAKIAALKTQNADLKKQMKELSEAGQLDAETMAKFNATIADNNRHIKSLVVSEKVLQNEMSGVAGSAANLGDSFNEQAKLLSLLKEQYSSLTKAQRESAEGKAMLKQLQELDMQVKANDASMGNFQRNVGNYPKVFDLTNTSIGKVVSAVQGLGGGAQTAGQYFGNAVSGMTAGIKGLGKAFLTPPVAVITLVVGGILLVFEKLKEAFAKNDNAMTALQRAFANFQPVITLVNKALQATVEVIGNVVEALSNFVFGQNEASEAARQLVTDLDNLEDKERDYTRNSAKRSAEVAEIRARAADKERYSAKEREAMLQQAIDLEKRDLADRKAIAEEKLRLFKSQIEQEGNTLQNASDEQKNKLAELEANVYKAEEEFSTGVRRLNRELTSARRENAKEAADIEKARVDAAKAQADKEAEIYKELQEKKAQLLKDYEDRMLSLIQDAEQRRLTEIELQRSREVEVLKLRLQDIGEQDAEARAQINAMIEAVNAEAAQKIDEFENEQEQKRKERLQAEYDEQLQAIEGKKQLAELRATNEDERRVAELEAVTAQAEMLRTIDDETKAALFESEESYIIAKEAAEKRIEELNNDAIASEQKRLEAAKMTAKANAAAVAGALGSLSKLLGEFGEENEEAAKASKAIALGEIAVNTGLAIAAGVAQAQSVPFPANIAAIATTIATVMANIASAVSTVKSAKFATGGVVEGDRSKVDSVPAMLTAGEVVLNADQQARLLFNLAQGNVGGGSGNIEAMQIAMSNALQAMPAPIMVYSEFEDFRKRTAQYNELATI